MTLLLKNHLNEFVSGHDWTTVKLDAALVAEIARRAQRGMDLLAQDRSVSETRYWDASPQCIGSADPETEEDISNAIEEGDGWSIVEDNALGSPAYGDADCTRMVISTEGGPSVGWTYRVGSELIRTVDVPLGDLAAKLGSPLGDPLGKVGSPQSTVGGGTRMTPQQEAVTKATQCADLLVGDLREAHSVACRANPVLAILLRDLIAEAASIKNKLAELDGCLR